MTLLLASNFGQARHTAPVDALTDDDHESVASSKPELSGAGSAHTSLPYPTESVRAQAAFDSHWCATADGVTSLHAPRRSTGLLFCASCTIEHVLHVALQRAYCCTL